MMDVPFDDDAVTFDPLAEGFNGNNALYLAAASNLAYETADTIRVTVGRWGYPRFEFLDSGGSTQGFVCANQHVLWLVFRGTQITRIKDIFTDLEFKLVANKSGGKTHEGFTNGLDEVWKQIQRAIQKWHTDHQPVWIAGHSLGAALAALAAERLHRENQLTAQGVYTFGQPRIGNYSYAKRFNQVFSKKTLRFVNNNDIVARLPPPELLLGYRHVKRAMYIDAESRLRPRISLLNRIREDLKGAFRNLDKIGLDALEDHSMDRYLADIVKIAKLAGN